MANNFQKWARNGRLATVALVVLFITWLAFQIWASPIDRPPFLNELLWLVAGGWLSNVALAVGHQDERIDVRIGNLENGNGHGEHEHHKDPKHGRHAKDDQ